MGQEQIKSSYKSLDYDRLKKKKVHFVLNQGSKQSLTVSVLVKRACTEEKGNFRAAPERSIFSATGNKNIRAARSHVARTAAARARSREERGSQSSRRRPGTSSSGVSGSRSRLPPPPHPPPMVLLRHISIALTAAVAALGSALFIALNYFYKRRLWSPQAEYCTIKEVGGQVIHSTLRVW